MKPLWRPTNIIWHKHYADSVHCTSFWWQVWTLEDTYVSLSTNRKDKHIHTVWAQHRILHNYVTVATYDCLRIVMTRPRPRNTRASHLRLGSDFLLWPQWVVWVRLQWYVRQLLMWGNTYSCVNCDWIISNRAFECVCFCDDVIKYNRDQWAFRYDAKITILS